MTICEQQREPLFGAAVDGTMQLNPCGGIVHGVTGVVEYFHSQGSKYKERVLVGTRS